MSLDARLTQLMPALSGRERAILELRSFNEHAAEDPSWRLTMPPGLDGSALPSENRTGFSRLSGFFLRHLTNRWCCLGDSTRLGTYRNSFARASGRIAL